MIKQCICFKYFWKTSLRPFSGWQLYYISSKSGPLDLWIRCLKLRRFISFNIAILLLLLFSSSNRLPTISSGTPHHSIFLGLQISNWNVEQMCVRPGRTYFLLLHLHQSLDQVWTAQQWHNGCSASGEPFGQTWSLTYNRKSYCPDRFRGTKGPFGYCPEICRGTKSRLGYCPEMGRCANTTTAATIGGFEIHNISTFPIILSNKHITLRNNW